jgi:uncharacterized membrane protein (UPF0136 family)
MTAGWFYFSFVALYLVHMQEEYWTDFTHKLPPPRLVGSFADRGFWVLNPFLLSFATAVGVANLMGATWAIFWVALWASICLWNAAAHGLWSLFTRAYQPGLISGLLYGLLFAVWARLLKMQGNFDWAVFWPALLIGLGISLALAGFAYFGRRILL